MSLCLREECCELRQKLDRMEGALRFIRGFVRERGDAPSAALARYLDEVLGTAPRADEVSDSNGKTESCS